MTTVESTEVHSWPIPWPEIQDAVFPRLNGHKAAWIASVSNGLRQRAFMIEARDDQDVTGTLPILFVSGPLFGKFLVSIPYINTGGVWAKDDRVAGRLIDAACDLADAMNVRYLELRHEVPIDHPRLNHRRTDKFHMRLALPDSSEALMDSFKSKLRSQVKKTHSYGHAVRFGGSDLLGEFYSVFAHNMRDLGTPVFSRSLFANILDRFGDDAELCVVSNQGRSIAAGLLVHADGLTEVPSASALRDYNRMGANMFMYQHLLERAIERGSRTFDFGRSSKGSGTYKFKEQWGAEPFPAVWQYYVRKGSVEAMRPDNEGNQRLIRIWQKLPVWLTRLIGPSIVRGIP